MTVTGQQFEIAAGDRWAVITEVGANLRGYRRGGVDVTHLHPPDAIAPKSSGAVLMPWPNRVAGGRYTFEGVDQQLALSDPVLGNASHGLACWIRWRVLDYAADEITLGCDPVPQKGWPHELRLRVTYRLDSDGLTVTLAAENTGLTDLPFAAGSHPYLSIGDTPLDDVVLQLPATHRLLVDDRQIPVGIADVAGTDYDFRHPRRLGSLRVDTAFTGLAVEAARSTATLVAGGRTTRMWWDDAFTTAQLFTLDRLVDGPAVAIEPMTAPANAFNSGTGLLVLPPGGSWSGQWGIDGSG